MEMHYVNIIKSIIALKISALDLRNLLNFGKNQLAIQSKKVLFYVNISVQLERKFKSNIIFSTKS